jgi:hypothetical protein
MSNFEDTLVNPNNSAGNYQPANSAFIKNNDDSVNASDALNHNNGQRQNKIKPSSILKFGLLLIITVAFVFVISQAF